jgi:hypothetical protein
VSPDQADTRVSQVETARGDWPIAALCMLLLEAVLLIAFQVTSAPILAKTLAHRNVPIGSYLQFLAGLPWRSIDTILAAALLVNTAAILVIDLYRHSFTRLLNLLFSRGSTAILTTLVFSLVAVRYYFSSGSMTWGGDGAIHALYSWIATEGFAAGTVPIWTPLVSADTPYLQYYGFTFFYLIGLLDLLIDDLETTLKVTLGLAHVASGLTAYLYVRTISGDRLTGFFAAACYVLSFWHLQQVLIMGRFPLSLVYAVLPLPFYACELLRRSDTHRKTLPMICGAISIGFLFCTHPGYALWGLIFLVSYVLYINLSRNDADWKRQSVIILGGLFLVAYLVIPMWVEREWVNLDALDFNQGPAPTLNHLFAWSNYRARLFPLPESADHWYVGYLGIVPFILCWAGLLISVRSGIVESRRLFNWAGLALGLFLVFGSQLPWINDLTIIRTMGSGRFLIFVVFFLAVSAAFGFHELRGFTQHRSTVAVLLALLLVDLGTTTFRQPYHFREPRKAMSVGPELFDSLMVDRSSLPPGQFVPERTRHTHHGVNNHLAKLGRLSTIAGQYHEHPKVDLTFVSPLIRWAKTQIGSTESEARRYLESEQGQTFAHGLSLLNTRRFIHSTADGSLINIDLGKVSPIIVSNRLSPTDLDPGLSAAEQARVWVRATGLIPAENRCRTILVSSSLQTTEHPSDPIINEIDHRVWVDRTSIRFRVSQPAYARLSCGYYPYLEVTLDGADVDYFRTADGQRTIGQPWRA